ncbi:zinc ribbon domain-containing protein [Patescibacteria group bacterium]|nr:zinc ribbon domain-containing protein [Patescibacteria group bacterium]
MITEEEYDRVQIILGRKGKPRPKKHKFAFTGLMRCGNCGAMITAEEKIKRQQNGNVHHYIYYHCTGHKDENCEEKAIRLENLNTQIDQYLNTLTISEKFKNWAIKYLHEIRQQEAQSHETILENKQKLLAQTVKQIDNLLLKYTSPENADGELITNQEFKEIKGRLLKEKLSLEEELKTKGKEIEDWVGLSERTFNFACYARTWFVHGDLETKRAIFACLGSHLVLKDQILAVELHKVFSAIKENKLAVEKELVKVRTSKNALNKRHFADLATKCPSLCAVRESNPRPSP